MTSIQDAKTAPTPARGLALTRVKPRAKVVAADRVKQDANSPARTHVRPIVKSIVLRDASLAAKVHVAATAQTHAVATVPDSQDNGKKMSKLETRRQFFKKCITKVLPVLTLLATPCLSLPVKSELPATGCNGSCKGSCRGSCKGSCKGSCQGCKGGCKGQCQYACGSSCQSNCSGNCGYACDGACSGDCGMSCSGSCAGACSYNCSRTCGTSCAMNCSRNCRGTSTITSDTIWTHTDSIK